MNRGERLNEKELERIAKYAELTYHARKRINERNNTIDYRKAIKNSFLAFYNTDGAINIAIDVFSYFVVVEENKRYKIVTFVIKDTGITVYDKWEYAKRGYKKRNI